MPSRAKNKLHVRAPRLNHFLILRLVADSCRSTQAEIARKTGLSVAMVNNYMKELCASGLLEYRRKSARVVSYHLTPTGERELAGLGHEWIGEMVRLFASAKSTLRDVILSDAHGTMQRVVLFGSGDLAELVFHALESAGVSVIGICDGDPDRVGRECCGREVLNPSQIRYMAPEAVILLEPERDDETAHGLRNLAERGVRLIRLDGAEEHPLMTGAAYASLLTDGGGV